MTQRQAPSTLQNLLRLATIALLAAAVTRELRIPAAERTWHGRIGVVPYDLRPPTVTRVRAALWNPEDPRVMVPQPVGIGWTVNLGRVWRLLTER
jgi:ABC-type sugar transport system substrate-binding protein